MTDTIKESADGKTISRTLDRSKLWSVQTPQTFRVEVIRRAISAARQKNLIFTDDTAACELIGQPVQLVASATPNPKVTVPGDLPFIEALLNKFLMERRSCGLIGAQRNATPNTLCLRVFVVNFSLFMKRRLIFGLVAVLLALNLAIGAKIYLSSAHAADRKDSPDANLEIFADVLEKVTHELCGRHEFDLSRAGLFRAQGHGWLARPAQRISWTRMITSSCRTTRKGSSAGWAWSSR